MILKEFDLDDDGQDKTNIFGFQTRCTTSLFETFFPKFKTEDCWKILVECTEEGEIKKPHIVGGVYFVPFHYSVKNFLPLTDQEKKVKTLDLLKKGIDMVLEESNWNPKPFEEAYKEVIGANYQNHWHGARWKTSPGKQYKGNVFCEHEIDDFTLYLVINDKSGKEIKKIKAFSDLPDEFIFTKYFGKIKWISKTEFCLFDKKGEEVKIVKV